ncbi:hypothetical protein ACFL08_02995 [Patescibacteria group bacterium]
MQSTLDNMELNQFGRRLSAIRLISATGKVSPNERHQEDVTTLSIGGVFSLRGKNYLVQYIAKYLDVQWRDFGRKKTSYWLYEFELVCMETGEICYGEWEKDDEPIIFFTEGKIEMRTLSFDGERVTRELLNRFADEEDEDGYVEYQGKRYYYNEDATWAALYFRGDDEEGIPLRIYEFKSDDGENLTVEVWHTDEDRPEREVFRSVKIHTDEISVIQLQK